MMQERSTIEEAEAILGLDRRHIQKLAKLGHLPGVAKIGRRWTFSLSALREHVRAKEEKQLQESLEKLSNAELSALARSRDRTPTWASKYDEGFDRGRAALSELRRRCALKGAKRSTAFRAEHGQGRP